MSTTEFVRARETFFAGRRIVRAGDLLPSGDQIIKGREHLFSNPDGTPYTDAKPKRRRRSAPLEGGLSEPTTIPGGSGSPANPPPPGAEYDTWHGQLEPTGAPGEVLSPPTEDTTIPGGSGSPADPPPPDAGEDKETHHDVNAGETVGGLEVPPSEPTTIPGGSGSPADPPPPDAKEDKPPVDSPEVTGTSTARDARRKAKAEPVKKAAAKKSAAKAKGK